MKKNYFLITLMTMFLVACSTEEKVEEPKKTYSKVTENYYHIIENGGTYAPRERNYRVEAQPKTNKRSTRSRNQELESIVIDDQILREEKRGSVTKALQEKQIERPLPVQERERPTSTRRQDKLNQNNEHVIEMNQLAAYFCMQQRNSPRFRKNENACSDFTDKQIANCLKKNPRPNSQLVKCVRSNLK